MLQLLLAAGAAPNSKDAYDSSPLGCAVTKGPPEAVVLLLQHGAKVHVANVFGRSLLGVARVRGHPRILDLMAAA